AGLPGPIPYGQLDESAESLAVFLPPVLLGSEQASYPDRSGRRADTLQPNCAARIGRSFPLPLHRCRRSPIITQPGIDDMEGLLAALESFFDERKQHPILLVRAMKERADMTLRAED